MENPFKYINKKLLLVISAAFLSVLLLFIYLLFMNETVRKLHSAIKINNMLTELRNHELGFLETKNKKFITKFQKTSKELITEIDIQSQSDADLEKLSETVHDYRNSFILISNRILTIGITRHGELEKTYNRAFELLEKRESKYFNQFLKCALSEKNFLINNNQVYVTAFNKDYKTLRTITLTLGPEVSDALENYRIEFEKMYNSVPAKGINIISKDMDDMISSRKSIEKYIRLVGMQLSDTAKKSYKLLFSGILMLLTAFGLGLFLITELMQKSKKLKLTIEDKEKIEDELVHHKNNLEKIVDERTVELKSALEEVTVLSGLLPICASCKKIRDDKGYWNRIEDYLSKHSDAEFSHSICPECTKEIYPEIYKELLEEEK